MVSKQNRRIPNTHRILNKPIFNEGDRDYNEFWLDRWKRDVLASILEGIKPKG